MITSNDLYDIYYTFLLIRSNIKYELNSKILNAIIEAIYSETYEDNSVRKALHNISDLDSQKWNFVFHNNIYTYRELIKNEQSINVIFSICNRLNELIEKKRYEEAYDFVDSIHNIPLLMLKKRHFHLYHFNKLTKQYQKKWGKLELASMK